MKYDIDSRLIEILQTDELNSYLGKTSVSYENSIKIVKKYDDEGKLYEESISKINDDGYVIKNEKIEYYPEGYDEQDREVRTFTTNTYQGKNLLKIELIRYGNIVYSEENRYDLQNNLVSTTINTNEIDYTIFADYRYNDKSLILEEILKNNEKEVYRRTFFMIVTEKKLKL